MSRSNALIPRLCLNSERPPPVAYLISCRPASRDIPARRASRILQGPTRGLAAVQAAHRDRGYAFDVENPVLTATVIGIRRTLLGEPRQVAPLTGAMLRELLASPRGSLASIRDAALMSTLYLCALRRSELVGLDIAEHGDGTGILRIGPDSLSVRLLASKGSSQAPVLTVVPRASNPQAVDAIEQWIAEGALPIGQPFMPPLRRARSHRRSDQWRRHRLCYQGLDREALAGSGLVCPRCRSL